MIEAVLGLPMIPQEIQHPYVQWKDQVNCLYVYKAQKKNILSTHPGAEIFSVIVPSLPEPPLVELPRPSPSPFELNSIFQPMLHNCTNIVHKEANKENSNVLY